MIKARRATTPFGPWGGLGESRDDAGDALFAGLQGKLDGEFRALAGDALDTNTALMLLDDLPAHAQAQAVAAVAFLVGHLGGVKRLEDQAQLVKRDADASVADANLGHVRKRIGAHLNGEPATGWHRLTRVDDQVQQDLLDLPANDRGLRPTVKLLLDLHLMLAQVFTAQQQHIFDQAHQIDQFAMHRLIPRVAEHAADDGGGALAAFEDLFERLDAW